MAFETQKYRDAKKTLSAATARRMDKSSEMTRAEAWDKSKIPALDAEYRALQNQEAALTKACKLASMENDLENAIKEGKVSPEQEAKARAYLASNA